MHDFLYPYQHSREFRLHANMRKYNILSLYVWGMTIVFIRGLTQQIISPDILLMPPIYLSFDYTIKHLTFHKDSINNILHTFLRSNTNLRINRNNTKSVGFIRSSAKNSSNSLSHLNYIHIAEKNNRLKTINRNTFTQNRSMETNKLLRGVFAPSIQSIKENLTIDFLTVNNRSCF